MSQQCLTYRSLAWVTVPEVDTDLLWTLSAIFVALAVLYLVSVFFFRTRIAAVAHRVKRKKGELAPMISEFLFYEEDGDKTEKSNYINLKIEIRELLKDDFNRKVLTEMLLDIRKDVSGDTQKTLFNLYRDLGLEKDAFRKLESWRWELISKGILELTQMNVESAYSFIIKFINDKRSTIRKQAEIATVTLKPEGINYFLDTTKYKISEWQQLKLLDVIRNQENYTPPRFKNWLTSTNRYVVLFALRAIKYYNQNDAKNALLELVKHRNNQIKQEAIGCIKEFYIVDALPVLKQAFWKSSLDVKISILDTIAALGSAHDIDFLRRVEQSSGNFSVKSKALSAINVIAPDTIMPTIGIENVAITVGFSEETSASGEKLHHDQQEGLKDELHKEGDHLNPPTSKPPSENQDPLRNKNDESSINVQGIIGMDNASEPDELEIERPGIVVEQGNIGSAIEEVTENAGPIPHELQDTEPTEIEEGKAGNTVSEETLEENIALEAATSEKETKHKAETRAPCRTEQEDKYVEENVDVGSAYFSLSFDFLPIVTANTPSPVKKTVKQPSMANSQEPQKSVKHIEVEFEEVISNNGTFPTKHTSLGFDIREITFLPIVTDNENDKKPKISISGDFGEASLGIGTQPEKEPEAPFDTDRRFTDEIGKLDFLPLVTEPPNDEENYFRNGEEKDVDGFTLADFEVTFDKAQKPVDFPGDDSFEEHISSEEPDMETASEENEDVISWLMSMNELRELDVEYESVSAGEQAGGLLHLIPEPVYYDEHESYMMGLLDDLEDLGDHREVPFLKELLAQENKAFVKDRIQGLIDRFTRPSEIRKDHEADSSQMLPFFSVFADLFKNLDVESKLILLDEVVAVGDHKEIDFLDGLLEDPNTKIRKKASMVLKQLIEKLSNDQSDTTEVSTEPLGAERQWIDISGEAEPSEENGDNRNYNKLMDTMEIEPSGQREVFEIDFELLQEGEGELEEKILNLPVEMVVVSPEGRNFLSQLRTFPKKIRGKRNG